MTYTLSDAGALQARYEVIGNDGAGTFTQTGGTNTVTHDLYIGYAAGVTGTYALSGTGALDAPTEYIGYYGTGTIHPERRDRYGELARSTLGGTSAARDLQLERHRGSPGL